jgi:pyruvate/2-oxoglutarate dehydrogenase complex dihydrolipoamide dehydrogenase (E3) component
VLGGFRNFSEQTSIQNIFAAGDILHGVVHNEPAAAMSGRRVALYIHSVLQKNLHDLVKLRSNPFEFMPYCLFSTPEIAGIGMTHSQAELSYPEGGFCVLSLKKASIVQMMFDSNFFTELGPENSEKQRDEGHGDLIQIIYDKINEKILGLHYLGQNAADIISGYVVS